MLDALVVGLIVAAAAGYVVYRYAFRKSGGCSCGCGGNAQKGSGCCCGGNTPPSCGGHR